MRITIDGSPDEIRALFKEGPRITLTPGEVTVVPLPYIEPVKPSPDSTGDTPWWLKMGKIEITCEEK